MTTNAVFNDVLLFAGRVSMSVMFLTSAKDKFLLDQKEVAMILSLGIPSPDGVERLVGVCEVAGAAMLIFGFGTRLGAGALALFVLVTTFAFLRFWSFSGPPAARQGMRNTFFGNIAVIGGLLVISVAGPGDFALWATY